MQQRTASCGGPFVFVYLSRALDQRCPIIYRLESSIQTPSLLRQPHAIQDQEIERQLLGTPFLQRLSSQLGRLKVNNGNFLRIAVIKGEGIGLAPKLRGR